MKDYAAKLNNELEENLNTINIEEDDVLKKSELSFETAFEAVNRLKEKTLHSKFNSQAEEIHFFKEVKPQFMSKLIYHISVYNIESNRPNGGIKILKKYYQNELAKLKGYFDNNLEFYRYHRTRSGYLDHKYFVRGKQNIRLTLDSYFFEMDPDFSTSHDFKVSKILANDLLKVYLEDELHKLKMMCENHKKSQVIPKLKLTWTASKVALIELVYALQSEGVFNNGHAELKEIATFLEKVFDIDLGQYHRTFLEIRIRKTGRTKFLDSLQESLIDRMDEADEK